MWHEGLLFRIPHNLPQSTHLLFYNYLTNRFFAIKTKDYISGFHFTKASVPLGSILVPFFRSCTLQICLPKPQLIHLISIIAIDSGHWKHRGFYKFTLTNWKYDLTNGELDSIPKGLLMLFLLLKNDCDPVKIYNVRIL